MKNFKIKKLSEIKHENLIEFYSKVFRERDKRLINNFQWCYRNGYNNLEPIVIEIENQIIGHAGLIPVEFKINGKINKCWFFWCPHTDSNREPTDYKSVALPIEL